MSSAHNYIAKMLAFDAVQEAKSCHDWNGALGVPQLTTSSLQWHSSSIDFVSRLFTSTPLMSFHFLFFSFLASHLISWQFISFHVISFHFVSFRFISFHFTSFHFVSFPVSSFRFISMHFVSIQFKACHFMSVLFRFMFIRLAFISPYSVLFHSIPIHDPKSLQVLLFRTW